MGKEIGEGCGCFLVLVGLGVLLSFPKVLSLIEKLIDKL